MKPPLITNNNSKNMIKNSQDSVLYNTVRLITDLSLIAAGAPLLFGGISAYSTFKRLPVPTTLEKKKNTLFDIEYKLLKHNPDLFTKEKLREIGEKRKKEVIEKLRKFKKEQEELQKEKERLKEIENMEFPSDEESALDVLTKKGQESAAEERFHSLMGKLDVLAGAVLRSPVLSGLTIAAPLVAFIGGRAIASNINQQTAESYTKAYANAAKNRYYNDILDIQLFNKKKSENKFDYKTLLSLPLPARKKLRDILLYTYGKDYGPYLGLAAKYPELLPQKAFLAENISAKTAGLREIAGTAGKTVLDVIGYAGQKVLGLGGFFLNSALGVGSDAAKAVSPLVTTVLTAIISAGLAYPAFTFASNLVRSYDTTKYKDPLAALEDYLKQKREITTVPEELIPQQISGLAKSVHESVGPKELLVGVLDIPPSTLKKKRSEKKKEEEEEE